MKMKKYVLGLALVFATTALSWSQTGFRRELSLGAGYPGARLTAGLFNGDTDYADASGNVYSMENHFAPDFHISYKNISRERMGWGGTFAYTSRRRDAMLDGKKRGEVKQYYYSAGAEFDFYYFRRSRLALYSSFGLGLTYTHETLTRTNGSEESDSHIAVSPLLNLLGVRYGERFGFFAELGIGYKGPSVGVFARF